MANFFTFKTKMRPLCEDDSYAHKYANIKFVQTPEDSCVFVLYPLYSVKYLSVVSVRNSTGFFQQIAIIFLKIPI